MTFQIKPDLSTFDLMIVRPSVQLTFAAHFMFEVLHCLNNEGGSSPDAGVLMPDRGATGGPKRSASPLSRSHPGGAAVEKAARLQVAPASPNR